jgi:hypothetical protein
MSRQDNVAWIRVLVQRQLVSDRTCQVGAGLAPLVLRLPSTNGTRIHESKRPARSVGYVVGAAPGGRTHSCIRARFVDGLVRQP